jgi:protein phosphatase 1 regulatory subunit 7
LEEIEELWASYNGFPDFGEVERELGGKGKLTTVYFEGCPLQLKAPALYRNKVRLALPQVVQIDASECHFFSFPRTSAAAWLREKADVVV